MTPRGPFVAKFGKFCRTALLLASLAATPLAFPPTTLAQTAPAPQTQPNPNSIWETAAGGHQEFDVISIHPNKHPDTPSTVNVPYSGDDTYTDTGGFFRATNWPVLASHQVRVQERYVATRLPSRQPARLGHQPGIRYRSAHRQSACDQRPDAPHGPVHAHPTLRPQGALRDPRCFGLRRRAHQARRFRPRAASSSQR